MRSIFSLLALLFLQAFPIAVHAQALNPQNQDPIIFGQQESSTRPINDDVQKYCQEKYETGGGSACAVSPLQTEACKKSFFDECIKGRNEYVQEEEAKKMQQPQQAYVPRGVDSLNILNTGSLAGMLAKILTTFIQVIGSIALVMFVYGGILWMTSQGNSEKIGHAVRVMVWSALGVIVILSSYAIVDFLFGTFG